MMFAAICIPIMIAALSDDLPAAIGQLSSVSAEVRSQASDSLLAHGIRSLPALRSGLERTSGEPRERIVELIREIGRTRLLRATKSDLNMIDVPVIEAIEILGKASGFRLEPPANGDHAWRSVKITLRKEGHLGFFEALDEIGKLGSFRQALKIDTAIPEGLGNSIHLLRSREPRPPTSYAGPYRLTLLSLQRHQVVAQVRPPAESRVVEELSALLEIDAEPGLVISPNGPIQVHEARDEKGQDLRAGVLALSGQPENPSLRGSPDILSGFNLKLPLRALNDRGQSLARLRGFVPIVALTRTDELARMTFPLHDGATTRAGGMHLTVMNVVVGERSTSLTVKIAGTPTILRAPAASGPRELTQSDVVLDFNPLDHLRVEDASGHALMISAQRHGPPEDGVHSYRIQVGASGKSTGPPALLRYFDVAAVATEIPFDFRDLPLP